MSEMQWWEPLTALALVVCGGVSFRLRLSRLADLFGLVLMFLGWAATISYFLSMFVVEGNGKMALGIMTIAVVLTGACAWIARR